MPDISSVLVVGRYGITVGDSIDPDAEPDTIWCDEGKVRITPLGTFTQVPAGLPVPYLAGHAVIEVPLGTDGYLNWQGAKWIRMLDLTSSAVNPPIAANASTHRIEYIGVKAAGIAVNFPAANVRIAADRTEALDATEAAAYGLTTGDLVVTLPLASPLPNSGGGSPIIQGPQGYSIAALDVVGDALVATLDDPAGTEKTASLPVTLINDDAFVADRVKTAGTATRVALDVTYARGREVSVEAVRLIADTDAQAIQRTINYAKANGSTRVILPKSYSLSGSALDLSGVNGVTFEGEGADRTNITATTAVGSAFTTTGACSDILFRGIGFTGNVVDDVTGPRRARTTSGSSFINAILLRGNLDPRAGSPAYAVRNIRLDDIDFRNISSLPILVQGIAGEVEVDGLRVTNCLDPGFIFNEVVKVSRLTSRKSADNGVSLSRGNGRVLLDQFDIEGCAYHGVWIAGYAADAAASDLGPTHITIGTGQIKNVGINGIQATEAPTDIVIGPVLIDGCSRGPSDEQQDEGGVGIKVGGYPYSTPGAMTSVAQRVKVTGATIMNAARGGIHLRGVTDVDIDNVTVINPGSAYHADGTTAVSAGDLNNNFGVAVDPTYASSVTRPSVRGVRTIETRGTPLTNVGVSLAGSVNPDYGDNTTAGTIRTPSQYDGAVAANGPAGTAVRSRVIRDGVAAFDLSLNSSNELEFAGRSVTDGSQLGVWMTIGRVTGKTTMGGALAVRRQSLAAAANLTFDANLYNHFSVVLGTTAVTAITLTNGTTGQQITITAVQDTTGGRAFPWPSNCKFAGAAAPTDTTANRRTSVTFSYDGTNWNEISRAVAVG